jgi:carbon monoxide dehydrogenase subunit G
MPSSERAITINRPIEEVFAFFADVTNDPKWRGPVVKAISVEGEMRQGAHVRQKLGAGPFGAPVKADMDVVVYEPSTAIGFQVTTGLLRPRIEFTFAPVTEGTAVAFSIDAPLAGLKKAMMGKMVQRSMDHEAAALDEAKKLLEA